MSSHHVETVFIEYLLTVYQLGSLFSIKAKETMMVTVSLRKTGKKSVTANACLVDETEKNQ
jgi:hypothetical protein